MSRAGCLEHGSQRRQRSWRRGWRRGFTLVELVVALGLAVVVLGGVFGAFTATTRNLTNSERRGEMDQVARIALDTLRRDLSSLHPIQIEQQVESGAAGETQTQLGVTFVGEDATGPEGRPEDSLRFTATLAGASSTRSQATVSAGRGDLAEVLYKLDVDEATPERGLVRVVNWQPGLTGTEAQPEVTQLAPTATSLQIRYYTTDTEREGVDADGWCEDWQDAQMVPNAVAVNLGLTADTPQAIEEQFNLTLRLPLTGARYKPPRPEQSKASEVTGDTKDGGIEAK